MKNKIAKRVELMRQASLRDEIGIGDLVDFGPYGKCYVCDPDYDENFYWITDDKANRDNPNAEGWSIRKERAKRVIEVYEDEDYDDDDDYDYGYDDNDDYYDDEDEY